MALIVGLLLIILGSVALWAWFSSVIIFVKGLVVFSLLFWGLLSIIIGYAGYKARRQLRAAFAQGDATNEGDATTEASVGAPLSEETPPPTA